MPFSERFEWSTLRHNTSFVGPTIAMCIVALFVFWNPSAPVLVLSSAALSLTFALVFSICEYEEWRAYWLGFAIAGWSSLGAMTFSYGFIETFRGVFLPAFTLPAGVVTWSLLSVGMSVFSGGLLLFIHKANVGRY